MRSVLRRHITAWCCVVALPLEAAYIADRTLAPLYPKPEAKGKPVATLAAGSPVEIVKRQDKFISIKADGVGEGWVEAVWVTEDKPAGILLSEAQAQLAELEQRLAAAPAAPECPEPVPAAAPPEVADAGDVDALPAAGVSDCAIDEAQLVSAREQLLAVAGQLGAPADVVSEPAAAEPRPLRNDRPLLQRFGYWLPLAAAVLGLLLGSAISWRVINRRVRDRFGGIQF